MTAKEYLRQYEDARKRAIRLEAELEEESLMVDAIRSSSDNDGMPHGFSISKPTEEKAIRLADKRLRLVESKLEAIRICQEVFDTIEAVGGEEAEILYQRHIKLKTWAEVCEAVYYSWYKVNGLYKAGLEKVEQIIN